ncbi:PASTA domain-containing protein [Phytohabitans sp. LJ34]|uniref:PASTA domain-containing protein n=1 Tax=Phytohabitans sp. LJ34 TaxID=3452217 RepID=UPI003F89A792
MVALAVFAVAAVSSAPGPAAAAPSVPRLLVIQVTWEAGNNSPAAPVDRSITEVASAVHRHRDWYTAVSHGKHTGWQTSSTGPISITPPRMTVPGKCDGPFLDDVADNADQAVQEQAPVPDLSVYSMVVYYFARMPSCAAGWGGGGRAWLNGGFGLSLLVVVQELAHASFGLSHANGLECMDPNGQRVTLSTSCASLEYADPFSAMGNNAAGSFTAPHQFQLGWLSGRMLDVPAGGGAYALQPLENNGAGLQVVRFKDGGVTLWIEYRQPIGVDATFPPNSLGVFVHAELPGFPSRSQLLDMAPQNGFFDSKLSVGVPWANPLGNMKITVKQQTAASANVYVEWKHPRVPNVVGSTLAQADAALAAAGFVRGTVSFPVDDTCNNIGRVMNQNPAAGAMVLPGTAVHLSIGNRPSHPCP